MRPPKLNPAQRTRPPHLQSLNYDERDSETAPDSPPDTPVEKMAPYPHKQLLVLAACRFSEPVAMTSSFPYLFFMIRDFHISDDEKNIGHYAGLLASSFSFAQFFSGFSYLLSFYCREVLTMTGLPWGRISDLYGRKPVVLLGLLGTVTATLAFGFSKSFTQALIARISAGLLNGNVGVIRTMVAEMVVERAHQARAFSVMPFVWSAGSILGPILGGAYSPLDPHSSIFYHMQRMEHHVLTCSARGSSLADPVRQYPGLFKNSAFLAKYPYALPNLVTALLLFLSAFFGFLFMKETLDSKTDEEDLGIRFRRFSARIARSIFIFLFYRHRKPKWSGPRVRANSWDSEASEFSSDEEGDVRRFLQRRTSQEPLLWSPTTHSRPRRPSTYHRYRRRSSSFSAIARPNLTNTTKPPRQRFMDIFTKQVVLNMVVYSGLALHNISFDQLFPLLCSTKIEDGGMEMTPGQIGAALSSAGILAMILQMTLFPWGHNKFGALFCLRIVLVMYAILYAVRYLQPNLS